MGGLCRSWDVSVGIARALPRIRVRCFHVCFPCVRPACAAGSRGSWSTPSPAADARAPCQEPARLLSEPGALGGLEHCRDFCSSALALLMPPGKRLLPLPDSSLLPKEKNIYLFSVAQLCVFLFFRESILHSPARGPVPRLVF